MRRRRRIPVWYLWVALGALTLGCLVLTAAHAG
jgi:hypothetical protein